MNVSTASSPSPAPSRSSCKSVVLRGTQRGLEIVIDADAAVDEITSELEARLEKSPEFFSGSDIVVRCDAPLPAGGLSQIESIASRYELRIAEFGPAPRPERVRASSVVEPVDAGEREAEQGDVARGVSASVLEATAAPAIAPAPAPAVAETVMAEVGRVVAAALPGEGAGPAPGVPTRLVVGPVRSGVVLESVGHLVILGDVNPGAEVRAERGVIVLGALRGIAHAGCLGEPTFILALRLEPQQLRIGELIARAGDADSAKGPEIAYSADGRIIVEDYRGRLPGGRRAMGL